MGIEQRIKKAREAAGLSKSELARRLGVHPSTCIQWESEGGTRPSMQRLIDAAVVLGVSLEWLGTGRGEMRYGHVATEPAEIYGSRTPLLSSDEYQLITLYRALAPKKRKALLDLLRQNPQHKSPSSNRQK